MALLSFLRNPCFKWTFFLFLLIAIIGPYLLNEIFDQKFSLCSVRCRHTFGKTSIPSLDSNINGNRLFFQPDLCTCYQENNNNKFLGEVSWYETNPPPSKLVTNVCGADYQEYSIQELACLNNTYPLHSGSCGACSNENDIKVYIETRQTMSLYAHQCMVLYMTKSEKEAFNCFKVMGLSSDCTQCWIDNMKCSASTCFWPCLWYTIITQVAWSEQTKLNPCIKCDEDNCGPAFVKCAGANRRRAGIVSDILRPDDQVWRRTAC